jgi:anti-sigma regulatory factor (Ser/Thr protein kinase)
MSATTAARTGKAPPCPGPPKPAPPQSRRACLGLDAVLTSPGRARAWTREILWEWRLACLTDTAQAIVSELVSNAVLHASTGPGQPGIRLALAYGHGELAIQVTDRNPDFPQARHPAGYDENGRGLLMVQALSDSYGCYPLEDGTAGKTVCAVLRTVPEAPGGGPAASIP